MRNSELCDLRIRDVRLHDPAGARFHIPDAKTGGLPPLPKATPHALRRTYISIALLANGLDVKWVMSQVGHADSKMTRSRRVWVARSVAWRMIWATRWRLSRPPRVF